MLGLIVRFSIRYRNLVVALACLMLAYGGYRLAGAGLDIFPEFSPKLVILQTEAPGLSAEEVEVLVTQPIESALGGLARLEFMRSESIQGLSVINLIFEEGMDLLEARQLVSERVARVGAALPVGLGPPVMVPLTSSSATVRTIGFTSDTMSLMDLRTMVEWSVGPRLLRVPGVADLNIFGGDERQLQVRVTPEALRRHNVSLSELAEAAAAATGVRGAGVIQTPNQQIALRTDGLPRDAEDLGQIVLAASESGAVRIGDVAEVAFGPGVPISKAQIMGEPGIVVMVIGQLGANTLGVSDNVEAALDEFDTVFLDADVTLHPNLFRPADYIERSLENIVGHLTVGGLLVIGVLIVFLFNLRTAFISASAIPLSLMAAALVLIEMDVSLNIMVLGGLAIALGEVVDDAIIDTENIFRRLRENRLLAEPLPDDEVVYRASMEVRGSVVHASFIVALVFVPLLTLSGVAGRMFEPLGIAYILAILASLLVALTVTPALGAMMIARRKLSPDDPPVVRAINRPYGSILLAIGRVPRLTSLAVLGLCGYGLALLPGLGGEFLPELREGHYMIHTSGVPGTSLDETIRTGTQITYEVLELPGVRSVSQWAGRAERGADTFGSYYSEYEVDLEPLSGPEQQAVLDGIREILRDFPGVSFEANTFLIERVDETISGYTAPVVVNIFGNDLDELDRKALEIARIMESVPGATDVQVRAPPGTPVLGVRLQPEKLARWGIKPVTVMDAVQTAYEGLRVGEIYEGNWVVPVTVVLDPTVRSKPTSLARLPIPAGDGTLVALEELADIHHQSGRYAILRSGAQRVQTVTGNVAGRDLASFFEELKERVNSEVTLPATSYLEFTGSAAARAASQEELIVHSLLAGVGIMMILFVALKNVRNTLLVLVNLPFSLVGGVIAALVTGATLSLGSLVGFVTLFGITLRNSIMLVSHYQHLVVDEGREWTLETAVQGAKHRLPSILITALGTALAMLPIAVDSDNPGREIMGPMAAIIIGGLASSTVLNLLILPAIMLKFGRFYREEHPAPSTARDEIGITSRTPLQPGE